MLGEQWVGGGTLMLEVVVGRCVMMCCVLCVVCVCVCVCCVLCVGGCVLSERLTWGATKPRIWCEMLVVVELEKSKRPLKNVICNTERIQCCQEVDFCHILSQFLT